MRRARADSKMLSHGRSGAASDGAWRRSLAYPRDPRQPPRPVALSRALGRCRSGRARSSPLAARRARSLQRLPENRSPTRRGGIHRPRGCRRRLDVAYRARAGSRDPRFCAALRPTAGPAAGPRARLSAPANARSCRPGRRGICLPHCQYAACQTMSAEARRAAKLARSVNKLARRTAAHDRQEEDRFLGLARRAQEARLLAPLAEPTEPEPAARVEWPRRRALLIVNSKSGPHKDSLLRIRDMVDLLAVYNIRAEVRVK